MEFGPMTSDNHENVIDLSTIFTEKMSSASVKSKADIQMTIFRVPDNIRMTNVGYFEPKIVSLGPYHHGNKRFRATGERIKLSYASNFFRYPNMDLLPGIVERFKRLESTSLCAYSEQISMTSDEFVQMMILDCAFMAEFLKEQALLDRRAMEEYSWKWATPSIVNDLLIVENQLPLRLLFDLLEIMEINWLAYQPSLRYIMQHIHVNLSPTSNDLDFPATLIKTRPHLLHLFHSALVIGPEDKTTRHDDPVVLTSFPRAEKLRAMRIQFANKTDGRSFLDISFDQSKIIMEIPQLVIDHDNVSLLRNLIALEQQCHGVGYYVSAYVWFMNYLINTDKDVAVLRQHKIIVSHLRSDEEVAHIFNELRKTDAPVVDFDHLYLAEEIKHVERYRRNRCNRLWKLWNFSRWRQNYFRNRWVTIGVTAAIFFNLLTLVQTVYAILSYAKQGK